MTSRERMMIALENGRPDRLPCQVHGWTEYYMKTYLPGMDWYQAYEYFGMDFAIYRGPDYVFDDKTRAAWVSDTEELGKEPDGVEHWATTITTPSGNLHRRGSRNRFTSWDTEHLIKTKEDFEIWKRHFPVPASTDFTKIGEAKEKLGDRGIIRAHPYGPGQGSPWQGLCFMMGTEEAIMLAMDEPDFVHYALDAILEKTLRTVELWKGVPADMVETGGGAGSNTVISPAMGAEFCVPYDRKQNEAYHEAGVKVVYHLCGGLMKLLDLVVESGADGLETMTPPSMGGDCDLAEASRKVGDKLFFIGGFDQNAGFEKGTPEDARRLVFECFEATKDHAGYIIAPSDHFFFGDPANLKAFADACKECTY